MRGGEAGRERGLPGKRLETTKGRWRSFLHMWACASVSNQSGGEKKEVHNKQSRGEGEGRKGGRIEYAYACTRKSLHCSLAAEVIQLARV